MKFQQVIIKDNIFIPQQMFQLIIETISNAKNINLFEFKYSDLLQYTLDYDYQNAQLLRQQLAKQSQNGSYYILICDYDQNLYYNELKSILTLKEISQLYTNMHSIMGITRFGFTHKLNNTTKNCLTILNKPLLQLDDWISTLEHQMTHFIQRLIGVQQTLDKSYQKKIDKDKDTHPDILRIVQKIVKYSGEDQKMKKQLINKFTYMLAKNQLQETLKTLLVMFKNMYQRQITYYNGKIINVTIKTDNDNKKEWLKQFLKTINSNAYLESKEFKNAIKLWKKKSILCSEEELVKHRYISYILCYLAVKNVLPDLNIDKKLQQYFDTF